MKRKLKPVKKKHGKALPPVRDDEFTAEAMRNFGEQSTRLWWQENAPPEFENLLEAKTPEDDNGD